MEPARGHEGHDRAALARKVRTLLIAAAVVLSVVHCLRFRDFTVDDAAISYAYSQNFAHGDGLVGVAGGERVEGYSNFLWVILLGVLVAVFGHIMIVAKVVGVLLAVAICIGTAELQAALRRRRSVLDAVPALLCAAFTPIPYWSMSGLENPLFLALTVWCCVRLVREADEPALRPWSALLAAALALTRPDGLALAAAALMTQLMTRHQRRRVWLWFLVAVAPIAAHVAWRIRYYGYPWPNTFYVKVAFPFELRELVNPKSRGWLYLLAFFSRYRLTALLVMAPLALVTRSVRPRLSLFAILAAVLFFPIYARGDWMSEGRFAVGAMPLLFVLAIDGIENLARVARRLPSGARVAVAVSVVLLLVLGATMVPKAIEISNGRVHHYPVPVEYVAQRARRYRELATALGVEEPSVADGDVGGNLMYAGMPVVDIGWLTDGTLAHWGRNPGFVREYIYRERRPTFLRLTGYWLQTHLQDYPEFGEYVPAPKEGEGLYIARSAFTVEGIDTRKPLATLGEAVALLGADVSATEVRLWLLARADKPEARLWLRTSAAQVAIDAGLGIYPPARWRAGEVIAVRMARPAGTGLTLCAAEGCSPVEDGAHGAAPVAVPRPSPQMLERLVQRGELEPAAVASRVAGQDATAIAAALLRRASREEANGETALAFADYERAVRADPRLSSARRQLEVLRDAPRAGYHPWIPLELSAATRAFYASPSVAAMTTLVQLARTADEPLRAVRAHLATGIVPTDADARIALAECYLAAGLPAAAAALVPAAVASEADAARVARIAGAAGSAVATARPSQPATAPDTAARTVAPGLELVSVGARLDASGAVLLDLVLRRVAGMAAGDTLRVGGRDHVLRRPPARWADGERVLETIWLPPASGTIDIGTTRVALTVAPFAADFERGALDGWTATGVAFEEQPRSQSWREEFGVQGNRYIYSKEWGQGRMTSLPLAAAVAKVCFFVRAPAESGVLLESGAASTPMVSGAGEVAQPACLEKRAGSAAAWHIAVVDTSDQARVVVDDFTCMTADGRVVPCAGSVHAGL